MITWPTTLPLPLIEFAGAPRNSTLVSSATPGRISRRTRFFASTTQISISWCLTLAQWYVFEAFLDDDLDNGAGRFEIELRYPKTSALSTWTARFIGEIEAEHLDGMWSVKAQLELTQTTLPDVAPLDGWTNFLVMPESGSDYMSFQTSDGYLFNVVGPGLPAPAVVAGPGGLFGTDGQLFGSEGGLF